MGAQAKAPFQLVGGHPVLDFANTLDNRGSDNKIELLAQYEDLLRFAEQSGVITPAQARELSRAAQKKKELASRTLLDATELRESIFQVFSAAAHGKVAPEPVIRLINRFVHEA